MLITWDSWLKLVREPLWRGGRDYDVSDVVPKGGAHRFGLMAKGYRFSRVLDEECPLFEADGSRGVRERHPQDAKGHDQVEPVVDITDGSIRSESGQLESPAHADAPCMLVDRLDDVLGRIMVSTLVSHVFVGRGLSRNVASNFKMLAMVLRRVHGADDPQVVSANHTSDDSSSFDFLSSEFGNVQAKAKTHVAASPGLGVTGDVVLVGEFSGGADGHGYDDDDKAKKGGRGQEPRPSQ